MNRTLMMYAGVFFASLMGVTALQAGGNTVVQQFIYCTGLGAICQQQAGKLNAIGDVVHIDTSKYAVTNLGNIAEEKLVTLALPEKQGDKVLYSFTPSTGEFAGKQVFAAFDYLVSRPGTKIAGKIVVMLYRSLEGAKATEWTEIATITLKPKDAGIKAKDLKLEPIDVMLKPDGTGVWLNPETGKPEVFLLGKKEFTEERLAQQKAEEATKAADIKAKLAQKSLAKRAPAVRKPAGKVPAVSSAVAAAA